MNSQKKEAFVGKIDNLLERLDKSTPKDDEQVKSLIQKAYSDINRPEKVNQQFNQVQDAISDLDVSFQRLALSKKYHFSSEQNDVINKLRTLSRKSLKDSFIGAINGAVIPH